MERVKISVEIEEWVGIGIVYSIDKTPWMSEEEFFTILKSKKNTLDRIIPNKSKNDVSKQEEVKE